MSGPILIPDVRIEAERPLRHYCVVRADLSLGQKFAQLLHAAGESAVLGTPPDSQTSAIALEGTLEGMTEAISKLEKNVGVRIASIVETEGALAGHLLAIGIEPSSDNRIRKILYHFKQLGEPPR